MKDFNEFKSVMESYIQMKTEGNLNENEISDQVLDDIFTTATRLEINDPKTYAHKTGLVSNAMRQISKVDTYVVGSIGKLISSRDLDIKKLQITHKISVSDTDKIIDGARELELNDPKSGRPYKTGKNSREINNLDEFFRDDLKYYAIAVAVLIIDKSIKINDLISRKS